MRTPGLQVILDAARAGGVTNELVNRWLDAATGGRPEYAELLLGVLDMTREQLANEFEHAGDAGRWTLALDDLLQALPADFDAIDPSPGADDASEWRPDPDTDPLLSVWNATLTAGLELIPDVPSPIALSDAARTDLAVSLVGRVLACVVRALEPELVVARAMGLPPGEALLGDRKSWLYRLAELPGLAHPLGLVVQHWRDTTVEMLERLAHDIDLLATSMWSGERPMEVVRFSPDAGDPHEGGRSVCLIRFDGEQRVVYKPKPQAGSVAWQNLLTWAADSAALRESGIELGTRIVLDCGEYGWDQTLPRDDAAEVGRAASARWLRSYGALICLLEVVEAADMWFDNLMTSDGLPQFIDVETVLQPRPHGRSEAARRLAETCAPAGSVSMRLPLPDGTDEDIGGLRPVRTVRLPFTERIIGTLSTRTEGYGVDGMMRWQPPRYRPDFPPDMPAVDELLIGYRAMDSALGADPSRALESVTELASAASRVVLRSTFTCYVVTRESLRPEVLTTNADREIALARLLSPGVRALAEASDELAAGEARRLLFVGASDRGAIRRVDIPLVRHDPRSAAIVLDDGGRHEEWYDGAPLDRAAFRIQQRPNRKLREKVLVELATAALAADQIKAGDVRDSAWLAISAALVDDGCTRLDAEVAVTSLRA